MTWDPPENVDYNRVTKETTQLRGISNTRVFLTEIKREGPETQREVKQKLRERRMDIKESKMRCLSHRILT